MNISNNKKTNEKEKSNMGINDSYVGYPITSDQNIQSKIYAKREFYYYKIPEQHQETWTDEQIASFRKKNCSGEIELQDHQQLLRNYISPHTPYKGIVLFHGVGPFPHLV